MRGLLVATTLVGVLLLGFVALSEASAPAPATPIEQMVQIAVNPSVQAEPEADRPVLHVTYQVTRTESGETPANGAARIETWRAWRRADGSGREDRDERSRLIDPAFGIISPSELRVEDRREGGSPGLPARDDGTAGSFGATIGGYPINQSLIDDLPRHPATLRAKLTELVAPVVQPGVPTTAPDAAAAPPSVDPGRTGVAGTSLDLASPADRAARDVLLFRGTADLLVSWLAPPALRSAALEVVGGITGVTVRAGTDPRGRAVLVATLRRDGRTEVYIDPTTSAVTGYRVVDADGAVVDELEVIEADWVETVPQS